jgi:hypothetical protein
MNLQYGPGVVGVAPLVLAAQAVPERPACVKVCRALLAGGARLDSAEVTALVMYRVGSSITAVRGLLGLGAR